jgi:hypothetical protein
MRRRRIVKNKLLLNKKYYIFFLIIISSVLFACLKSNYTKYINARIYFLDNTQNQIEQVNPNHIKSINNYNEEFERKYRNLKVSPENSKEYFFRIEIRDKQPISEERLDKIYEDYKSGLKNIGVFFVSRQDHISEDMTNVKGKSIFYSLITAVIFILSLIFLENSLDSNDYLIGRKNIIYIGVGLGYLVALFYNFVVILIGFFIVFGIINRIINRNIDRKKSLIILLKISIIIKIAILIVFNLFNYLKYGTLLNYTQPDELFYYSTADYIYERMINFSQLRILEITGGVKQFGYNIFLGILKVLNNGEIIITAKIINSLIGLMFIFIIYEFVYKLLKNHVVAILTSYMMATLLTFSIFSSIALRDVLLSLLICLILKEVVIEKNKITFSKLFKIIIFSICLCSLRIFVFMIIALLLMLYKVIEYSRRKSLNLFLVILTLFMVAVLFVILASKFYKFNLIDFIYPYIKRVGLLGYIKGLILSSVNLDFIVNLGGTIYTSTKTIILRILYPDTLFLVVTFPFMILGFANLFKKNQAMAIIIVAMFIAFITIYTVQYGGWFLRIQLQIFPYQYMLISLGIFEMFKNSRFKFINKLIGGKYE